MTLYGDGPPTDLEVVPTPKSPDGWQPYKLNDQAAVASTKGTRAICGIRRTTFLLLVIVAVLIVAGGIGGGVGGSIAVQKARNSAPDSSFVNPSLNLIQNVFKDVMLTLPVLLYSLPSSVNVTVTATAPTATQFPVTAPKLSCPQNNNTVYAAANGGKFVVTCNADAPNNDLAYFNNTSNLNDCIEHCAYYNRQGPSVPCVAAVLAPYVGDCWIKSLVGSKGPMAYWLAQECDDC
jgi:hypothetical protein